MKWPPTLCWTAPKTINGNRHFQVKAYGGKNEDRWGDIFPTKKKKDSLFGGGITDPHMNIKGGKLRPDIRKNYFGIKFTKEFEKK